jgi:multidrug efflux pump subunit AcrA (membrane-fusion protein)
MEEELINSEEPVHTEQIQDIIGTPPRWLYRWGITVVLSIALMCILTSSVINYPETVKTQLKILSTQPPENLSVKDAARLIKILVPNDTPVKKGDDLAVIEYATGRTIITAPISGKLTYAGIIHENEQLAPGRDVFFIAIGYNDFYGEMIIPQNEFDKVKPGQTVLVKFRSSEKKQTTFKGAIRYIINDQFKNGGCFAEVDFEAIKNGNGGNNLLMRNGMMADAEIITAKATLFQRLIQSLTRGVK